MPEKRDGLLFPWIISVYGVIGTLASLIIFIIVLNAPVAELPDVKDEFLIASNMLSEASLATGNVGDTLVDVRDALVAGSKSTRSAALALQDFGRLSQFEIAGFSPFRQAGYHIENSSNHLIVFSERVMDTSTSLNTNIQDIDVISKDLAQTANMFESIYVKYEAAEPVKSAKSFSLYILGYFIVLHAMFIFIGMALMRRT